MARAATLERGPVHKDAGEEAALDRAADALAQFMEATRGASPKSLAAVAISAWIIERTRLCAAPNFNAKLLFDLKDTRLRGLVETALPAIGRSVMHLPADVPFFELDKASVVDLFVAAVKGVREADGAAMQSSGAPFSDDIPFG